ncbi:MAG: hypothetical protein HOY79_20850 [Streptomyces sp.]|nr:hypothetical protein [Streptomyces sp.]
MTFLFVVVLIVVVAIIAILILAILAGRAMSLGGSFPDYSDDAPDDFDPLPRQLKPLVPEQWQHPDDPLRDTPNPHDPAS